MKNIWLLLALLCLFSCEKDEAFKIIIDETLNGIVTVSPKKDSYEMGENVKITVLPNEGYIFHKWEKDIDSGENPVTVTIKKNLNIGCILKPKKKCSLVINQSERGNIEITPKKQTYYHGDIITLKATASKGFKFEKWGKEVNSKENPISFTIEKDMDINGIFNEIQQYSLIINQPTGGKIEATPMKKEYYEGEQVTVTAIPDQDHSFTKWIGADGENPLQLAMSKNIELGCELKAIEKYVINITATGGTVEVTPQKEKYAKGDIVSLKAIANKGYQFEKWGTTINSNQNPTTITIENNIDIQCIFKEIQQYSLTITQPTGGKIEVTPQKEKYLDGEKVTVRAIPDQDYSFVKWTGVDGNNPLDITIKKDMKLSCEFKAIEKYVLNITSNGGQVEVTPKKSKYAKGEVVTLKAIANQGYIFKSWTGITGDTQKQEVQVTITDNCNIDCIFVQAQQVEFYLLNGNPEKPVRIWWEEKNPNVNNYLRSKIVDLAPNEKLLFWSGQGEPAEVLAKLTNRRDIQADYNLPFKPTIMYSWWSKLKNWKFNGTYYYIDVKF